MPGKSLKKPRPTHKELARVQIMHEMGMSNNAIGDKLGRGHETIRKYLARELFTDPRVKGWIDKIRENEKEDLALLGAKARENLHQQLDSGLTTPIENIAAMDRSFQQRRLLEGGSTQNIHMLTQFVIAAHQDPEPSADDSRDQ